MRLLGWRILWATKQSFGKKLSYILLFTFMYAKKNIVLEFRRSRYWSKLNRECLENFW